MSIALGIDIGTSGVRCAVINEAGDLLAMARTDHQTQDLDNIDAEKWWQSVQECIRALDFPLEQIERAAIDGTSGTVLLVNQDGEPVSKALMYNDKGFQDEAEAIADVAPDSHIARGNNSALARALHLFAHHLSADQNGHCYLAHQADFILGKFLCKAGLSDHNNALKTGFDAEKETWPDWMAGLANKYGLPACFFPQAGRVGAPAGTISPKVAQELGLSSTVQFYRGTTDSIAAHIATGALEPGAAVSSIGTTLALKIVAKQPVDEPRLGIYSHRIGDVWLAGGASNAGGGVLLDHFSLAEIEALTPRMKPELPTGLAYYPLSAPGERFPVNDPELPGCITPRPDDDAVFLQGLMEGVAAVEALGYEELVKLGAPKPTKILTCGGAAKNEVWQRIRSRVTGLPVERSAHEEASIGVAKLCFLTYR